MGLFDRLSRVARADPNSAIVFDDRMLSPKPSLDQQLLDSQEELIKVRQAIAQAMVAKVGTEEQYNQSNNQAADRTRLAQLALQQGDEKLAREALVSKKSFTDVATQLKVRLDTQTAEVDQLNQTLIAIERDIDCLQGLKTRADKAIAEAAAIQAELDDWDARFASLEAGSDEKADRTAIKEQMT